MSRPPRKMNTKQRRGNFNGRNGSSRLTSTMPNANYVHRKNACTRNGVQHFFNSTVAIALFALIMIVSIRLSCGLIDLQAEKEKHGKFANNNQNRCSYNNAMNMNFRKWNYKGRRDGNEAIQIQIQAPIKCTLFLCITHWQNSETEFLPLVCFCIVLCRVEICFYFHFLFTPGCHLFAFVRI